jgi:hypothetical protein
MLHIACVTGSSTLVCHFSLPCCIVFCLSSFCILRSILHVSLGSFTLDCPFNGYFVVLCLFVFGQYLMLHIPCLWGRSLSIVPSTVTLLYCVLFVFVLYLMLHVAFVSWVVHSRLSLQRLLCCIVFCLSSFCILCSILLVSLGRQNLIAPLVYCVALCFVCLRSVSYASYCMCLWLVHS